MAMVTLLSALVSFVLTLLVDVFALIPFFNFFMATFLGMGLVVSNLDYQVAIVLTVVILSIPLFALIFALVDSVSTIVYKSSSGY
jgi:hypothetical protein